MLRKFFLIELTIFFSKGIKIFTHTTNKKIQYREASNGFDMHKSNPSIEIINGTIVFITYSFPHKNKVSFPINENNSIPHKSRANKILNKIIIKACTIGKNICPIAPPFISNKEKYVSKEKKEYTKVNKKNIKKIIFFLGESKYNKFLIYGKKTYPKQKNII